MSEPKIVVYDSQRLNAIQDCMRKFQYSFQSDVEPILKPSYFEKGDLLHRMLEVYYNCKKYRSRWQQNGKTHADIVESCIKAGRFASIKMQISMDVVEEVITTFRQYTTHYVNDDWNQIKAVEQVGCKPLYTSDRLVILYDFKIDLIISIPNCQILPIDHKSSSSRHLTHPLSNQFMGYCWGLGVNNILVNKIGFQKTVSVADKMSRVLLSYTSDNLQEWQNESTEWIIRAEEMIEKGYFPRNLTACDKYAGCIYRDVCKADREIRLIKLERTFSQREKWDVGASL